MNSDRAQLSIAVLFSIAVHGVIVLFGDFFAGQGAIATNSMPIAVTIAAAKEAGVEIPKPSPQESDSDIVEPAKRVMSITLTRRADCISMTGVCR